MQFLILVATDENHTQSDADAAPGVQDWFSWVDGRGVWRAGSRLRPPETARMYGSETVQCGSPAGRSARTRLDRRLRPDRVCRL